MQIHPRCNFKSNKHFVNDKEKSKIPNKQIGKYVALRTIRYDQFGEGESLGFFWVLIKFPRGSKFLMCSLICSQ
jgi:hypothetical protein